MSSIDQAKAKLKSEKNKIVAAVHGLAGTRVVLAVCTLFMTVFAAHLVFAPDRLPGVAGLSLAQVGLPSVDFGEAGRLAEEARRSEGAAMARSEARGFFGQNPQYVPVANGIGFGASFVLLIWNMFVAARRWRTLPPPLIGAP